MSSHPTRNRATAAGPTHNADAPLTAAFYWSVRETQRWKNMFWVHTQNPTKSCIREILTPVWQPTCTITPHGSSFHYVILTSHIYKPRERITPVTWQRTVSSKVHFWKLTVIAGVNIPTTPTASQDTVFSLYGYLMESSSQKKPRWNGRMCPNSNTTVGKNTATASKQQEFNLTFNWQQLTSVK